MGYSRIPGVIRGGQLPFALQNTLLRVFPSNPRTVGHVDDLMTTVPEMLSLGARALNRVMPPQDVRIATCEDAGMTEEHFVIFRKVSNVLNRVILVRQTNPHSAQWIRYGYPGKPKELEPFKTGKDTGLVTARPDQLERARNTLHKESGQNFLIVERNREFASNATGLSAAESEPSHEESGARVKLVNPRWHVRPGQFVHPTELVPFVGDYDLFAVITPESVRQQIYLVVDNSGLDTVSVPTTRRTVEWKVYEGGNVRTVPRVVEVTEEFVDTNTDVAPRKAGRIVSDITNPDVKQVAEHINQEMDRPRILHGPEEAYGDWNRVKALDTVVGFFPQESPVAFSKRGLMAYYASIERQMLFMKRHIDKQNA